VTFFPARRVFRYAGMDVSSTQQQSCSTPKNLSFLVTYAERFIWSRAEACSPRAGLFVSRFESRLRLLPELAVR